MEKKTEMHPRFAPLTLDFTFKKVFASGRNPELLISLINAFLGKYLPAKAREIHLLPTEKTGKTRKRRAAFFDLHCEDGSGNKFIIEMQFKKQRHFIGRVLFYISKDIAGLAKKGRECEFGFPRIFSLSFLNFEPDEEIAGKDVLQHIGLCDLSNPKRRYNQIHIAFVILPRFRKTLGQCRTTLDLWLYLFKNLHKLEKMPPGFGRQFKPVFEAARISNFTESELRKYEADMKCDDIYKATIAYAKEEGEAIGREEGVAIGEARGVAIGEARGLEKAARSMLADGLDPARVARITRLPKKAVMALR